MTSKIETQCKNLKILTGIVKEFEKEKLLLTQAVRTRGPRH